MREHRVLPFYMAYPLPMEFADEYEMMRDLEYLQQLYPADAKRYQKKIVSILDKMDYEGSVIYDAYPDRWSLYRLAQTITDMIRKEEENREDGERTPSPEKWLETGNMVQILLFYEIYKRRHQTDRGIPRFF